MDRIAIGELDISGFELMNRAGQAIFSWIKANRPQEKTITVFCGAGNNGGDGYVVARLALLAGWDLQTVAVMATDKLKGDALKAFQAYLDAGGEVISFSHELVISGNLIVDAILGSGLDRDVTGSMAEVIENINASNKFVVAADIPSGLNADTGKKMGVAVKADCTFTLIALKKGLFTGDAAEYCGEINYDPLQVPETVFERFTIHARRVDKKSLPRRSRVAHKGQNGHVLIVGGAPGFSGAVKMAGEAALRTGAGLVTIATSAEHAAVINCLRPELMCHAVTQPEQLAILAQKAKVIVLGPGLGTSQWAKALFETIVKLSIPLIIDADGLNLLAHTNYRNPHWILTPHPGEAARLLSASVETVEQDRYQAVRDIQAKYDGIIVLKGPGTLIDDGQVVSVSTTGNPGMASGGMGDVLTGIIAGLIAQGFPHRESVEQGVYIHGAAADLAAEKEGERGLLATDLMPYIRMLAN